MLAFNERAGFDYLQTEKRISSRAGVRKRTPSEMCNLGSKCGRRTGSGSGSDTTPTPTPGTGTAPPGSAPHTSPGGTKIWGGEHRDHISLRCFKLQHNCSAHFLSATAPEITGPSSLRFPTVQRFSYPSTTQTRAGDAASLGMGEGGVEKTGTVRCPPRYPARPAAGRPRALGLRNKKRGGWGSCGEGPRGEGGPAGVAALTLRIQWPRAAAGSP